MISTKVSDALQNNSPVESNTKIQDNQKYLEEFQKFRQMHQKMIKKPKNSDSSFSESQTYHEDTEEEEKRVRNGVRARQKYSSTQLNSKGSDFSSSSSTTHTLSFSKYKASPRIDSFPKTTWSNGHIQNVEPYNHVAAQIGSITKVPTESILVNKNFQLGKSANFEESAPVFNAKVNASSGLSSNPVPQSKKDSNTSTKSSFGSKIAEKFTRRSPKIMNIKKLQSTPASLNSAESRTPSVPGYYSSIDNHDGVYSPILQNSDIIIEYSQNMINNNSSSGAYKPSGHRQVRPSEENPVDYNSSTSSIINRINNTIAAYNSELSEKSKRVSSDTCSSKITQIEADDNRKHGMIAPSREQNKSALKSEARGLGSNTKKEASDVYSDYPNKNSVESSSTGIINREKALKAETLGITDKLKVNGTNEQDYMGYLKYANIERYHEEAKELDNTAENLLVQLEFAKYLLRASDDMKSHIVSSGNKGKANGSHRKKSSKLARKDFGNIVVYDLAMYWINRLARSKVTEAMEVKAGWLRDGFYGYQKNSNLALNLFMKAAQLKSSTAALQVATYYESKSEYSSALSWYTKACHLKNAKAYYVSTKFNIDILTNRYQINRMAVAYLKGELGLQVDVQYAHSYLKLAGVYADKECPYGAYVLGQMYLGEKVVDAEVSSEIQVNTKEAMRMYAIAADNDCSEACYRLGYHFQNGLPGIRIDHRKAIMHYERGAGLDNRECAYALARIFFNGWGPYVQPNYEIAYQYTEKAAGLGHPYAKLMMGWYYDSRAPVKYTASNCKAISFIPIKNDATANEWYKRAANAGVKEAFKYMYI